MLSSAIPVAVTGFTWSAGLLALLNVFIGGLLVALVRTWPSIRKLANDREANLLEERAADMEGMRKRLASIEKAMRRKDIVHEAERRHDRHRINNLANALNGFFMMVKAHPEDAAKAAETIEAMRETQIVAEQKEGIELQALIARLTTEDTGDIE